MQFHIRFQVMALIGIGVTAAILIGDVAVGPDSADSGSLPGQVSPSASNHISDPLPEESAAKLKQPVLPVCKLDDSAGIGPCPKSHSPVVRQGLDSSGQPTWWHADGSMTVRVKQGYTAPNGQRQVIPRIVVVRPAPSVASPKK